MKMIKSLLVILTGLLCNQVLHGQPSGDYLSVKKDNKWGLISRNGEIIVRPDYDGIESFDSFGFAKVFSNNKIGLIDGHGKIIVSPVYDEIRILNKNYFTASFENKFALFSTGGNRLSGFKYNDIRYLGAELFSFSYDSLYGVFDKSIKIILGASYEEIELDTNGFLVITGNRKCGIAGSDGKIYMDTSCLRIRSLNNRRYAYQTEDGFWGVKAIDINSSILPEWENVFEYNDLLGVQKNNRWKLFTMDSLKQISDSMFDNFYELNRDYFGVTCNNAYGVINRLGKMIITPGFSEVRLLPKVGFILKTYDRIGISDLNGRVILPEIYDDLLYYDSLPYFGIYKNSCWGLSSLAGEILFAPAPAKVEFYPGRVKIYEKGNLRYFDFDINGNLVDSMTFENIHQIVIDKDNATMQVFFNNRRSASWNSYGWYQSLQNSLWGLADTNGKLRISPRFTDISIYPKLNLTIVESRSGFGNIKFYMGSIETKLSFTYGLADHTKYRIITSPKLLDLRISDFEEGYNVSRAIIPEGNHFAFLYRNGLLKNMNLGFIGQFSDSMLVFNSGGKIEKRDILKANPNNIYTLQTSLLSNQESFFRNIRSGQKFQVEITGGKWGFTDKNGKIRIPPVYTNAKDFSRGRAVVQKNGKWGVIDKKNHTIVDFQYDQIDRLENTGDSFFRLIKYNNRSGIMDNDGKIYSDDLYHETGTCTENLIPVKINGKWGYADKYGKLVIQPQFNKAGNFSEGLAAVKKKTRWGYIDPKGNFVIEPVYRKCGEFHEGLAYVNIGWYCGYIDHNGKLKIKNRYLNPSDFQYGVATVQKGRKRGIINQKGKWVLRPSYNSVSTFNEYGIAIVEKHNRYGLVNYKGKKLTLCRFREIKSFSEGMAAFRHRNRYGYLDTSGKIRVSPVFLDAKPFTEGYAGVRTFTGWGFIDVRGKIVIKPEYTSITPFSNRRAIVKYRLRNYIIDPSGNYYLKNTNSFIYPFSENLAVYRSLSGKYSYIDTNGNPAFSRKFEMALPFQNGRAFVRKDGLWGVIDRYGNYVVFPQYVRIKRIGDSLYSCQAPFYSGMSDLDGKLLLEPKYATVRYLGNGIFQTEIQNKSGYFKPYTGWIWRPTQ